MKTSLLAGCFALACVARSAFADPAAEVKAALRDFLAQPNYSWSVGTGALGAPEPPLLTGVVGVRGQHEKGGYSLIHFASGPHIERDMPLARVQAGITNDDDFTSDRWVFETASGRWVALEDLPLQLPPGAPAPPSSAVHQRSFSSRRPDHEVALMLGQLATVELLVGGIYRAQLTADGAASLIVPRPTRFTRMPPIQVDDASAVARFWVAQGKLVRFEVDVVGTRVFSNGRREPLSYMIVREFTAIGTTVVDVPPEVRKMLRR